MKIIRINETQYKRLFEGGGDSIFLDGDDSTKQFSSEVSNQSLMDTEDGEDQEYSNPVDTNKFAKQRTSQEWESIGYRNSSNTI